MSKIARLERLEKVRLDNWRADLIALLRKGEVDVDAVLENFDIDTAAEVLQAAGLEDRRYVKNNEA